MSKTIFSLIFVAIIGLSLSTTCSDNSSCPDSNTCCVTSSGFSCCPFLNGSCCLDGANCCPNGYICQNDTCSLPAGKASLFLTNEQKLTALIAQIVNIPSVGTIVKCINDIKPLIDTVAKIAKNLKSFEISKAQSRLPQLGLNGNALLTDCNEVIALSPVASAALLAKFPSVPNLVTCLKNLKPVRKSLTQIIQGIVSKNIVSVIGKVPQFLSELGPLAICEKVILEMS